ncbi:MAG TPA: 2-hydroxymuconate tautomerase [Solirubrobacterales bacterium]|nr:2-hydroxymuconate tautomerase [Solirubrobacterales bacterium]
MPVITIKMYEGRTREQKDEIAKQITKTMVDVAKTTEDHVWVVFEDMKKSDFAIAGQLQDEV